MHDGVKVELSTGVDAPQHAREAVAAQIAPRLSNSRLDGLLLVVSELVTNSVKYGPGGEIRLSVEMADDGAILGRVEDGGRGHVAIRENVDPADGGMGLKLVDAFTDRWGVEQGTTNVWFEFAARRFGQRPL